MAGNYVLKTFKAKTDVKVFKNDGISAGYRFKNIEIKMAGNYCKFKKKNSGKY